MAYTIYGDGEIWKDGRKYGTIYSDGEIWRDGELYAKVYSDGEIWKDSRKIGKIYDDGEVWINNASWGRIYCREEHTPPPTPMQNDYSETNNSAYSVPDIPDVGGGGVDWDAFGIFAAGFFILFLISCVVGVFVNGFDMWREFTVGRIEEFGFPGAIAAGILIVGVIYGFVTQFSKFNGGFIVGLIIQSVIICVASFLGAIVVAGIESFTLEGMNPIEYISMFIFMALFPALLCKLIAVVANKMGLKSSNSKKETKAEVSNNWQVSQQQVTHPTVPAAQATTVHQQIPVSNRSSQNTTAVNNTQIPRVAVPAPQAANAQRPVISNNTQTPHPAAPAPQASNLQIPNANILQNTLQNTNIALSKENIKAIDIFKLSPKKNCKECGHPTCMSFCFDVEKCHKMIEKCPYFSEEVKNALRKN